MKGGALGVLCSKDVDADAERPAGPVTAAAPFGQPSLHATRTRPLLRVTLHSALPPPGRFSWSGAKTTKIKLGMPLQDGVL